MGFAPGKAVGYMNTLALKFLCPANVILFVKAGFKFNKDCNLLVPIRSFHKSLDNPGVVIDPV